MKASRLAAVLAWVAGGAMAEPLDGQSYIVELTSSQYASGYYQDLLPSLASALESSGLRPVRGGTADVVVNIVTDFDVGQWIGQGDARQWLHTLEVTVGVSPEAYVIPEDGTPAFGVRARLLTPNPDRADELSCLIALATRTAVANYRPTGHFRTDGSSCARK